MSLPELVPLLTPGRHRSPRKGACLMELTSHLAGEPWSDHPQGTHPLLAEVARRVNDLTGDGARQRLTMLAPDLAGLAPRDPRLTPLVARECALAALAVEPTDGYAAAVALLHAERALAQAEERPPGGLTSDARHALAALAPAVRREAESFVDTWRWRAGDFEHDCGPAIVRTCLSSVAHTATDPDATLVELLERCVALCRVEHPTRGSATMSRCTPRSSSSPARRGQARAGSPRGWDSRS